MAIDDRLDRIEGEFGAELCAGRYCRRIYHTELIILPDGREVVTGEQPLPLCDTCPEHQKDEPRIRHIEVKRDYRRHTGAGAAEDATRRAVAPSAGRGGAPQGGGPEAVTPADAPSGAAAADDDLPIPPAGVHTIPAIPTSARRTPRGGGRGDRRTITAGRWRVEISDGID